ncbi:MAG: hypothetical protein ABI693_29970 [Bryobacteraceae bacterium]
MLLQADTVIGRAPEDLSIEEHLAVAGQWVALEIYTPITLPQRRIQALGATAAECVRHLLQRGIDPSQFEFVLMRRAY